MSSKKMSPRHTETSQQKSKRLSQDWERLQKDWDKFPSFSKSKNFGTPRDKLCAGPPSPKSTSEPRARIPSRVTSGGSAAKKSSPVYTGTSMIGIATLHKSCEVPVFSKEDAVDISKMRRG